MDINTLTYEEMHAFINTIDPDDVDVDNIIEGVDEDAN